jgi:excisionase family DNA binding protein
MEKIFTTDEVAEYLSIPKSYVWKLIREGKLPAVKLGKYYRVQESDLKNFLEKNKTFFEKTIDN